MSSLDNDMRSGQSGYRFVRLDDGFSPPQNLRQGRDVGANAQSGFPELARANYSGLAGISRPAFNVPVTVAHETASDAYYYATNKQNAQYFRQGFAVDGDDHSRRVSFGDGSSLTISAHEIGMSGRNAWQGYTCTFADADGNEVGKRYTYAWLPEQQVKEQMMRYGTEDTKLWPDTALDHRFDDSMWKWKAGNAPYRTSESLLTLADANRTFNGFGTQSDLRRAGVSGQVAGNLNSEANKRTDKMADMNVGNGGSSALEKYKEQASQIAQENMEASSFAQKLNAKQTMHNNIISMMQGQNTQAQTNAETHIKQANKGAEMMKSAQGN